MTLWTSADAAGATGGRATTGWAATGISIDTRTIRPGDLFVALTDVRDGHDFVAQALDKGAAAALVSRIPDRLAPDAPLLLVPDVLAALWVGMIVSQPALGYLLDRYDTPRIALPFALLAALGLLLAVWSLATALRLRSRKLAFAA